MSILAILPLPTPDSSTTPTTPRRCRRQHGNGARLRADVRPALSTTDDPLFDAALQALRDQGATLIPVDLNATNLPTRVWDYEFKKDINAYLSKLPAQDKVRTLGDIIAYNQAHAQVALKFGETLLEGSQAIDVDDPATAAGYEALRVAGLAEAQSRIDTTLATNNITAVVLRAPVATPS